MEDKALDTIARHGLFAGGGDVFVALSGGADSVALFHLLHTHAGDLGIRLSAAHFEHGLRGEESRRDEAFVRTLCEEYGVPLVVEHGGMDAAAKPAGESVEAWARRLRYDFFWRVAEQYGAKVATAHTLSDNAETVLFHAIRGAGTRGLSGIAPVRGPFVRPLLDVSRAEVEAYCAAQGLAFVTDATNADTAFTRNLLRHEAMPLLERAHSGAAQNLARLAADMGETDEWLEGLALELLEKAGIDREGGISEDCCISENYCISFDSAPLLAAPGPLRRKALALLLGKEMTRSSLERALRVLRGEAAAAEMPGGARVENAGGRFIIIAPLPPPPAQPLLYETPLAEGRHALPGGFVLTAEVLPTHAQPEQQRLSEENGEKGLTFWADYGKIYHCGVLRTRRPGDRFAFPARGVSKPLKKWMNEQRMPPGRRASLPVLAGENGDVQWIWGEGFSAGVQPDETTTQVLRITQDEE